jgi:tetratricopeptide (TPR) repeat protein
MERTRISPTRSAALSFVGGMWGAGSMLTIVIGFVSLERGTGFFLLLVAGVLSFGVAIGLLQRHRWAYLATLVTLVPLAILAWRLMLWPILLPLSLALLRSYSDFHQPLQRMLPRLTEGNHEEHHRAGTRYRQQEMWYLAVQEWQAALQEQPHNETYRRNLGYAYLALRQPEQAYAELQTVLMSQPDDPTIQQVLQNLEQSLSQKQGSRTR